MHFIKWVQGGFKGDTTLKQIQQPPKAQGDDMGIQFGATIPTQLHGIYYINRCKSKTQQIQMN